MEGAWDTSLLAKIVMALELVTDCSDITLTLRIA